MNKELILWKFIAKQLKTNQPVMLLLVAESLGSSPGRQGFKMAVSSDGELCGSIGGGIMEVKLVELAKARLAKLTSETLVKKQVHRKDSPQFQSGMICSGEQTVLFIPLTNQDKKAAQTIVRCLQHYIPALLKVSAFRNALVFQVMTGAQNDAPFCFNQSNQTDFIFEENLGFKNRLFIVGGGHCALALSEVLSRLDFYLCLLDDRTDLSTILKNRFVHKIQALNSYEEVSALIPSGANVYVVIMTLGYRSDEIVLRQLLDKNLRYLGLLGSEAKVATLLKKLREENIPAEQLSKVHAPIGLRVHSRTPEEIAVSIAAEIIGVKNGS